MGGEGAELMNRQLFHNMIAQYGKETVISGGSANDIIEWSGGVHCALPSLKFYGLSQQYGTPTPENPLNVYCFTGPFEVTDVNYTSTPPLHGIGEYKDEWDYVTGKGIRRVASMTLDGVTSGKKVSYVTQLNGYYYTSILVDYPSLENTVARVFVTHFNGKRGFALGNAYMANSGDGTNRSLVMVHTDQTLTTVDQWNAWLKAQYDAGTPVTVYYALAEPISFEERPDYQTYIPIPNDSGRANILDGGMNTPFEVSYVVHSTPELCAEVEDIPSLTSSDNYVLQDRNGIYLNVKE
jgi:hypothetical protein